MSRVSAIASIRLSGSIAAIAIVALLAACTDSTSPIDETDRGVPGTVAVPHGAQPNHEMEHMRLAATLRPPTVQARYPNGRGNAEWIREDNHREMHFTARYLPPGLRVNFFVGGTKIGTTRTVNSYGRVALHVDSQHGQYVPSNCRGKLVVVKTTSGSVAVQGRFPQ
jgi:hypothetical protein